MTHQDFLNNFDEFSKKVFNNNILESSIDTNNQIDKLKSYLEDIPNKIKIINPILTDEVNRILNYMNEIQKIDIEKLKNDLFEIVHKNKDTWMSNNESK
jgi:Asp-tRNA(Asn)/Glu-tRNA(Gln) amidotransferase C subunit